MMSESLPRQLGTRSPLDGENVRLGVIGCGHWGPNHIRVFSELSRSHVVACADLARSRLDKLQRRFPALRVTTRYEELLSSDEIDAVVIATPAKTHAAITREALWAGKHVLVEKPLCTTSADAGQLLQLADSMELVLMVGHVFIFNTGINKLREVIASDELGRVVYLDAVRTNLGPIRGDVSVLYDLATHDISIFNYLLNSVPVAVSALGRRVCQRSIEDVAFLTLEYPGGVLGHIHVSWLNPRKVRAVTVVGERKMAFWDDVTLFDKLRLYNKGVEEPPHYDSFGEFQYLIRSDDVQIPKIDLVEPLVAQANAFLDRVLGSDSVNARDDDALAVIEVVEAACESMARDGVLCPVRRRTPSAVGDRSADIRSIRKPLVKGREKPEHVLSQVDPA